MKIESKMADERDIDSSCSACYITGDEGGLRLKSKWSAIGILV